MRADSLLKNYKSAKFFINYLHKKIIKSLKCLFFTFPRVVLSKTTSFNQEKRKSGNDPSKLRSILIKSSSIVKLLYTL